MKKRGFTLAEILITLGIVGVVAALTAPGLVINSRNQAMTARLAVIVSNLENAFHNMILEEDADNDISKTSFGQAGGTARGGHLLRYLLANGIYTAAEGGDFYSEHGKTAPAGMGQYATTIVLKNGGVVFISAANNYIVDQDAINEAAENGTSLVAYESVIYIDVNGADEPNVAGRDVYAFLLGNNGSLYPFGSPDVEAQGFESTVFDNTAKVIENGYKMNN